MSFGGLAIITKLIGHWAPVAETYKSLILFYDRSETKSLVWKENK